MPHDEHKPLLYKEVGSADSGHPNADPDSERFMRIYLYPYVDKYDGETNYVNEQLEACEPGGVVAEAIKNAAQQLLDAGSISWWKVYRYKVDDDTLNYPDWGDIDDNLTRLRRTSSTT